MGTLGTVINALALASALEQAGLQGQGLYQRRPMPIGRRHLHRPRRQGRARRRLCRRLLGGGTRQSVLHHRHARRRSRRSSSTATCVLKGTKVDGVYSGRSRGRTRRRTRFDEISHEEAIARNLKVMDTAAFALARDNGLPIFVYALDDRTGPDGRSRRQDQEHPGRPERRDVRRSFANGSKLFARCSSSSACRNRSAR